MPSFSLWPQPASGNGHIASRHAQTYALALAHDHKHDRYDRRSNSSDRNVEHLEFELQNYQELLELQRLREQARKQKEKELQLQLDLQRQKQKQKELASSASTANITPTSSKSKNGPSRMHMRSPPTSPTSPCSRMTPSSLFLSGAMQK